MTGMDRVGRGHFGEAIAAGADTTYVASGCTAAPTCGNTGNTADQRANNDYASPATSTATTQQLHRQRPPAPSQLLRRPELSPHPSRIDHATVANGYWLRKHARIAACNDPTFVVGAIRGHRFLHVNIFRQAFAFAIIHRVLKNPETIPDLDLLETVLAYNFKDRALLERAITHRSWAHEKVAPGDERQARKLHNESLEFLGDSVLGLVVANYLCDSYPGGTEGELSRMKHRLVSAPTLAKASQGLKLGDFLRFGRGEEKSGGPAKECFAG